MEEFEFIEYLKDRYDQLNYIAIEDKNEVLLREVQLCKDRDINIMKKLKRKMNMLTQKGYEVMFIALYGSQNYGLDCIKEYNGYDSDVDCIACIVPNMNDIVSLEKPLSTTIIDENNEHIVLKDVRVLFDLYSKQNLQYIETLYTPYRITNKKYRDYFDILINKIRSYIFYGDCNRLCDYVCGVSKSFYKDVINENTQEYNKKALSHLVRMLTLLKNNKCYFDNMSHRIHSSTNISSIQNDIPYGRACENMISKEIKLGEYEGLDSIEQIKAFRDNTMNAIIKLCEELKGLHISRSSCLDNKLNTLKTKIITQSIANKDITDKHSINLSKYDSVYIIGDTHFGHKNILDFGTRKEDLGVNTIEEYDNKLIELWNKTVSDNDMVIIMGDFSFHNVDMTMEILNKLKGHKCLIRGNHDDRYLDKKSFDKTLFDAIWDYKEIEYEGTNLVLCHYPIQIFKHIDKSSNPYIHLFAHIHGEQIPIPKHSYCTSMDIIGYRPVHINYVIDNARFNKGGIINGQ